MSVYQKVHAIALEQAAAAERGDWPEALSLLDVREQLLLHAGEPEAEDEEAIRETLRLDRELASAIRQQMMAIREESLQLQHARVAVSGYGSGARRGASMLDTQR